MCTSVEVSVPRCTRLTDARFGIPEKILCGIIAARVASLVQTVACVEVRICEITAPFVTFTTEARFAAEAVIGGGA
tara:strand:+ start:330 stop:557 length:228 start_codon:yes stop_codon:yes gene_type:complete